MAKYSETDALRMLKAYRLADRELRQLEELVDQARNRVQDSWNAYQEASAAAYREHWIA